MLLQFTITTERPIDIPIRAWREISRAGMQAVGLYWDQRFKMRHFEAGAESRYGYKPRSAKYLRRKRKGMVKRGRSVYPVMDGGASPIVFSGDTRGDIRPPHYPVAMPTRLDVRMPTRGAYIQMRPDPRKRDAPNLGEELTRTTTDEVAELAQVYEDTVAARLVEYREASSRSI